MIKPAPSRTQRSKGIKVKHVLQICLLLGVCFWLIYQVKHSHDRNKEFDDKDAEVSVKGHSDDEILKLGRKDLPQVQEAAKNERHQDEEEDAVEEEENKPEEGEKKITKRDEEERDSVEDHEETNQRDEEEHEDEEQEEENKIEEELEEAVSKHEEEEQEEEGNNEETEDERRGGGDDELDEQDQERTEGEVDHEDEFIDEEKEREGKGDDRESEGNEGEEKNSQVENENSLDDHDHDHEGVNRNTHVAREEHYKADDASSAVSHDIQIIVSETEKETSENSNENSERNVLEEENKSNTTDEIGGIQKSVKLKLGEGEMAESGSTPNGTSTEEKDHGSVPYNSHDHSFLIANNTSAKGGTGVRNNSTGLSADMTGPSVQNGTETKLDANPIPAQNVTLYVAITDLQTTRLEKANSSVTASNVNQFDSNSTISPRAVDADTGTGYSFNKSASALSETVIRLNATADGEVNSGSSARNETAGTAQNEMSNETTGESSGTNESSDSSKTEGTLDANNDNESGETNEISDSSSTNEIVETAKDDLVDASDSSLLQDGKESRIDLGTLPDIRTEVDNIEEAAAE